MTTPAVDLDKAPYKESDDFTPNPTDVFGTLDTSATAGAADSKVETVTPIYEVAKAQDALQAARALDPEDTEVSASLVVLPDATITNEEAQENVKAAASAAKDNPVVPGGLSPYQRQAAEETGKDGEETAQAQQANTGANTSTQAPADTARQQGATTQKASKQS